VTPLLLLMGHGIVVSGRGVDGCGGSSFDPPFLFRFPRFLIEVSTCCLGEVPGVRLFGTLYSLGSRGSADKKNIILLPVDSGIVG
jgi:hypothetical protein